MPMRKLPLIAGALFCASIAGTSAAETPTPAAAANVTKPPAKAVAKEDTGDLPEEETPVSKAVPSLAKVIELARDRAPAVAIARANVEVSRSALVGARLGPLANPYVEVIADRGSQGTKDITVQGSLYFPLEVSGQREKRQAEAQALVDWQTAETKATRATSVGDAVRAYGQLVVADARIKALTELLDVARAEAAYYDGRVQAGDATELDAKLAEVEVARHTVALAEGRADRTRALTAIGVATGDSYTDAPAGGPSPPAPKGTATVKNAATLPLVEASAAQEKFHAREKDRAAIEAHTPLNLVVTVGRGDLGELRVGGGLAWSIPALRTNQGEQARAEASRAKASMERDLKARAATVTVDGLAKEREDLRKAIDTITKLAEPAAKAAVDAAVAMEQAGKGDLLRVLTARRDLALLQARRLDLLQREWNVVGDLVAITGELP